MLCTSKSVRRSLLVKRWNIGKKVIVENKELIKMKRKYYFIKNNERVGPFSLQELASQKVYPDTLFWHDGLENWENGVQIPELQPLFTPPPVKPESANSRDINQPQNTNSQTSSGKSNKNVFWLVGGFVTLIALLLIFRTGQPTQSNTSGFNGFQPQVYQGSQQIADDMSSNFIGTIMHKTYPVTGRNPTYLLKSWSYENGKYLLNIKGEWNGSCTIFDDPCLVSYDFNVEVSDDGKRFYNYDIYGKNDCARGHELCSKILEATYGELSKE